MRPLVDIIAESEQGHEALLSDIQDELEGHNLSGAESLAATEAFTIKAVSYVGDLMLSLADQVGALPDGVEAGEAGLRTALSLLLAMSVYEQVEKREDT